MMRNKSIIATFVLVASLSVAATGQTIKGNTVDKWVTTTGIAAGTGETAREEAIAQALRTAVEQACGVFLKAESKTRNYKLVYDKVFADAVGYVKEHEVIKTWIKDGQTYAKVKARVSTQKFEKDWAVIAHTVEQENNPRVIVAIVEAVKHTTTGPEYKVDEAGTVQTKIEDFFLTKGLTLMDRQQSEEVSKRDVLLAVIKNDTKKLAALGTKFKADVLVIGRASAKYGKTIKVASQKM